MVLEVADVASEPGDHVVQFYEHASELAQTVGRYLIDASRSGGVAVVIATEAHRRAFELELRAAGIDPAAGGRQRTLIWLDAAATLAAFMPEGRIDRAAFREVVGTVVRQAGETGRPVRAYGEMVAILWDAGDVLGAIELEELWNELALELPFSLLCGYHSDSVAGPEHQEALQQVCRLHSSVHHAPCRSDAEDLGQAIELSAEFAAELDAPRYARHFVTDALTGWGHVGMVLENARLLVTELATNAVVHAGSSFSVGARDEGGQVRVSVRDNSPVRPRLRDDGVMAISGRGLHLVAALSSDWGVDVSGDGKTVWVDLRS